NAKESGYRSMSFNQFFCPLHVLTTCSSFGLAQQSESASAFALVDRSSCRLNRGMKEPVLVRWIGGGGGASAPAPPPPAPEVLVLWMCGAVALLSVCSIARGFNRSAGNVLIKRIIFERIQHRSGRPF